MHNVCVDIDTTLARMTMWNLRKLAAKV